MHRHRRISHAKYAPRSLISHPIGKFCAYALPIRTWRFPRQLPFIGGVEFSLNPGPFNVKVRSHIIEERPLTFILVPQEHVLIYIMANVSIMPPYALSAIVVAEVFYGLKLSFWFNLTLVLATQLTGFGLAGLCRRFLVWPASMIWPQNLVACTLLNTLHAEDDSLVDGAGITRFRCALYTPSSNCTDTKRIVAAGSSATRLRRRSHSCSFPATSLLR